MENSEKLKMFREGDREKKIKHEITFIAHRTQIECELSR